MCCLSSSYAHLFAQRMNNNAALCFETGHYSRAIILLKKALEINNKKNKKNGVRVFREKICKCYLCTLDGCIAFSENSLSITRAVECSTISSGSSGGHARKRRQIITTPPLARRRNMFWKPPHKEIKKAIAATTQDFKTDFDCRYIYRRPIRVACEGHAMGSTLFLIIIFNLALAYHLEAVDSGHSKKKQDTLIHKILSMYKLAHNWQLNLLCKGNAGETKKDDPKPLYSCSSVTSIRFNMIIRNNLSQIHLLANDYSKYKRCLQFLLSTVMVVVEYKSRNFTSSHERGTSSKDPRIMDIYGFLQNTTPLLLGGEYTAQPA